MATSLFKIGTYKAENDVRFGSIIKSEPKINLYGKPSDYKVDYPEPKVVDNDITVDLQIYKQNYTIDPTINLDALNTSLKKFEAFILDSDLENTISIGSTDSTLIKIDFDPYEETYKDQENAVKNIIEQKIQTK